jgi:hypothetical protein
MQDRPRYLVSNGHRSHYTCIPVPIFNLIGVKSYRRYRYILVCPKSVRRAALGRRARVWLAGLLGHRLTWSVFQSRSVRLPVTVSGSFGRFQSFHQRALCSLASIIELLRLFVRHNFSFFLECFYDESTGSTRRTRSQAHPCGRWRCWQGRACEEIFGC